MNTLYVLPVGETLGKAWDTTKGSKKSFWAALALLFLIAVGIGILQGIAKSLLPPLGFAIVIIGQLIIFLLQIGLLYMGIQRAAGSPISYRLMFRTFDMNLASRIITYYILQMLILILPAILIFLAALLSHAYPDIPGMSILVAAFYVVGGAGFLYLSIRMMMGMAFVLDKAANPWEAVKSSFQITRGNFWSLLFLLIAQFIIFTISAIPFGIGLIWTLPFIFVLYGTIYKGLLLNLN
ncbi:MAG: hypothetical protein EPO11_03025 [Gammaproteobacteria bacterium]|nr:MAG: hypothetical protein EPO11_03025 [Gammaproteobacteria bacterium]